MSLKKELANRYSYDRESYTEAKNEYIESVLTKNRERYILRQIKTDRLILRPLNVGDLYTAHKYSSDPDNTRYMINLPNRTLDKTRDFLEKVASEWEKESPTFYEYAIEYDGKHIGAISVYQGADRSESELGWILNKEYWGNGYALEAATAIKDFACRELKIKKLIAHCDSKNRSSERLMQKIGLRLEIGDGIRQYPDARGVSREHVYALAVKQNEEK